MSGSRTVKVGLDEGRKIAVKQPAAAEISILMDGDTVGTRYLTENLTRIGPGVTLPLAHSHTDIEEIVFVLEGEGEMWMEGSTCTVTQGDSVFYPAGSKHTVRNTGDTTLVLLCFFSTPHYRKEGAYITHDDETF